MSTGYSITVQVSCFHSCYVSRVCSPALSGYSWNSLEDIERIHICDVCLTWLTSSLESLLQTKKNNLKVHVKLKTYISLLNMYSNN